MVKVDKRRLLAMGLCLTAFSGAALADSLDAQRQRYQQIKQAWDGNQMDVVAQLMPTLRDYPLYPYLEYRELTQDRWRRASSMNWRGAKIGAPCWPSAHSRPNRWRRAATITTPNGLPATSRRPGAAPTSCG